MKTQIVRIGNSQGNCIPKIFLERCNLPEEVELIAHDNQIIICSRQPRQGWGRKFQIMAARGDDGLLDKEPLLTATGRTRPKR